jgi:uncharacterized protein (TIGR00369 family)
MADQDLVARVARYNELLRDGQHLLSEFQAQVIDCDGEADLAMAIDVAETMTGPSGALQGGLVATLIDTAAAIAASARVGPEGIVATGDMTVHFLAPVLTRAYVLAHVVYRGKRRVVCRVELFDEKNGPLAATAQVSFAVINSPARRTASVEQSS